MTIQIGMTGKPKAELRRDDWRQKGRPSFRATLKRQASDPVLAMASTPAVATIPVFQQPPRKRRR